MRRSDTNAMLAGWKGGPLKFERHKYLSYQGYAFPWYVTLIWITFFICGLAYMVRYILFE